MEISTSDRRLSRRLRLKAPLRLNIWKSGSPEKKAESLNLSRGGICFATDAILCEGETVEIFLQMPEDNGDDSTVEWRWTGHVVRVDSVGTPDGMVRVGVQFDCYEVGRGLPRQG